LARDEDQIAFNAKCAMRKRAITLLVRSRTASKYLLFFFNFTLYSSDIAAKGKYRGIDIRMGKPHRSYGHVRNV